MILIQLLLGEMGSNSTKTRKKKKKKTKSTKIINSGTGIVINGIEAEVVNNNMGATINTQSQEK